MLMEMRNGQVAADVSRKLNELIGAIADTGAGGTMTLKLKVKPSRLDIHEGVKEVEITHECTLVKPEKPVGKAIFFVANGCKLSRVDPDQMEMFEGEKANV